MATSPTTIEARRAKLFERTTTPTLVQSALMLEAKGAALSNEERLTRAWITDEIERRHPEVRTVTDAWVLGTDEALLELSYTEVLISALPESAVTR